MQYTVLMKRTFLTSLPVAHRGLHDGAHPENSLSAFEAAARSGYAVETDVRFTKDGVLVAFHDDDVGRMTDAAGSVAAFSAADLASLRLAGTRETIPLFSDVVALLAGRVPLLIEIKEMRGVPAARAARAVREAIGSAPLDYAVQSFRPSYAFAYKKLCPDIPCGMLGSGERFTKDTLGGSFRSIKAYAVNKLSVRFAQKLDFLSYRAEDFPSPMLAAYRGVKLAWTVRSEAEAARVAPYADNIIFENFLPQHSARGNCGKNV